MNLTEHSVQVDDVRQPEGRDAPVDGVGPHEGQFGEWCVVQLNLDAFAVARGARGGDLLS